MPKQSKINLTAPVSSNGKQSKVEDKPDFEAIIGKWKMGDEIHYKIKWGENSNKYDSWESKDKIDNTKVKEFEKLLTKMKAEQGEPSDEDKKKSGMICWRKYDCSKHGGPCKSDC